MIWLIAAWRKREPVLLAAHQAMLALAAMVGTVAWLQRRSWVIDLPEGLFHPCSLQAFAVVLGLLSLAWIVVRMVIT